MRVLRRLAHLSDLWRELQRRQDTRDYSGGEFERFRRETYARLWVEAATKLGLQTITHDRLLTITDGRRHFRVWTNLLVDGENALAMRIANDKALTIQCLDAEGLPTPRGRAFRKHECGDAVAFARSLNGPCVVKPARNTLLGQGVTLRLTTEQDIAVAFRRAALHDDVVLVEEFVEGTSYRFLVYRGKCLSIIERHLPFVIGDGLSTIEALVAVENRGCASRYEWIPGAGLRLPIRLDVPTRRLLKKQGLSVRSVPAAGRRVTFASVSNTQNGTTCVELLGRVHPAVLSAAERAAAAVGLVLAGVDVISPDIHSPTFVINELNSQPGLISHYAPQTDRRDPLADILSAEFGAMRMAV
jgi:cyanophycin synthetase